MVLSPCHHGNNNKLYFSGPSDSLSEDHTPEADTASITLVRRSHSFRRMTNSKGCSPEEDNLAFSKANMESDPASAYPVNHFIEHFGHPPNYAGREFHEMGNLPPRATGTARAAGNFGPSETPRAAVGLQLHQKSRSTSRSTRHSKTRRDIGLLSLLLSC